MGTDHLLKVQARMEDKVRIKNLKSLFAFFEKFSRGPARRNACAMCISILPRRIKDHAYILVCARTRILCIYEYVYTYTRI